MSRGRYRDGRARPQFDRYVALRRQDRTLTGQFGTNFAAPTDAYALKASLSAPTVPATAPPAAATGTPPLDESGWKGWWDASGVTDPPTPEAPPVRASASGPVVWRTRGVIGSAAWLAPEVYEARMGADVRERSGAEGDAGGADVARTVASFRVRAANIRLLTDDLGEIPTVWALTVGEERWDVVEAIASWSTGRYVDLRAVRRESAADAA